MGLVWLFVYHQRIVIFLQLYTNAYVDGMSIAADSIICMEMNQLLILQARSGCSGCMSGSLLFRAI